MTPRRLPRLVRTVQILAAAIAIAITAPDIRADVAAVLPDPDGTPASLDRPVKVYVMMGQSNMLGFGAVEPRGTPGTLATVCHDAGLFPWLLDDAGRWTVRHDVRYAFVMQDRGSMKVHANDWLTPPAKGRIGPELGFGHVVGTHHDEPVLLLKACIGNRSLGWDYLPPGSERYAFTTRDKAGAEVATVFAGYKDRPPSWPMDEARGLRTEPPEWLDKHGQPVDWYAGKQYDDDVRNAKAVLADLGTFFPGAKGYEIAGFVWWQGHKDQSEPYAGRYEGNLVHLITSLRADFAVPNAPFVLATGCGNPGTQGFGRTIAEAQLAVDGDSGRHPEFKGNVKAVDVRRFWPDAAASPKNQDYHYHHNAETFMRVGDALGRAMVALEEGGADR